MGAEAHCQAERAAEQAYRRQRQRLPGCPPAFQQRIQGAMSELVQANIELEQAQARQSEGRDLLGELYHPYALENGQAQPAERLAPRFEDLWRRLKGLADTADLPTRAREHLASHPPRRRHHRRRALVRTCSCTLVRATPRSGTVAATTATTADTT